MIHFEKMSELPDNPFAWAGYAVGAQIKMLRTVASVTANAPQHHLCLMQTMIKAQRELLGLGSSIEPPSESAQPKPASPKRTAPARRTARKAPARKSTPNASGSHVAAKTSASAKQEPIKSAGAASGTDTVADRTAGTRSTPTKAPARVNKPKSATKPVTSAKAASAPKPVAKRAKAPAATSPDVKKPDTDKTKSAEAAPSRRRPRAPSTPPSMPEVAVKAEE